MNPTTYTIDGDYSQKLEIGHWTVEHHTGHTHGSGKISAQGLTQRLGPVTLTETVSNGIVSLSVSLATPIVPLPLGHFDLTKAGTHPINAKLDGGNWFKGTLTVA